MEIQSSHCIADTVAITCTRTWTPWASPGPPLTLGSCFKAVWSETAESPLWKEEPSSFLQPRVPPWTTHLSQEETSQRRCLSGSRGQGSGFNQGHRTLWVTRGVNWQDIAGLQSLLTLSFYFCSRCKADCFYLLGQETTLTDLTFILDGKAYNVVRHLKTADTPWFGISSIFPNTPSWGLQNLLDFCKTVCTDRMWKQSTVECQPYHGGRPKILQERW